MGKGDILVAFIAVWFREGSVAMTSVRQLPIGQGRVDDLGEDGVTLREHFARTLGFGQRARARVAAVVLGWWQELGGRGGDGRRGGG
jgi:hypothetical protein